MVEDGGALAVLESGIVLTLGANKVQPHSERPKGCSPCRCQARRKSAVEACRWFRASRKGWRAAPAVKITTCIGA